tara:strand:- start:77487 stop:78326 length:840 start_codon:yes stop_codon:yes gene_type:complete
MINKPDFSELLNQGYHFDIGETISQGWKFFAKSAGNFIGFTLIYIIISFFGSLIFAFIPIPFLSNIISIVFNVLLAGIFVFSRNLMNKQEDFGDFFKAFQSFGQIFLHYLVFYLLLSPIIVLLFLAILPSELFELFSNPNSLTFMDESEFVPYFSFGAIEWSGILLCVLAMVYLSISYIFAIPLIVDAKLGFWEAMEMSRKVVGNKFISFFGFAIIFMIITIIGILLTCGLGILVVIPFYYCASFWAYNSIFGPYLNDSNSQIDNFGSDVEFLDPSRDN